MMAHEEWRLAGFGTGAKPEFWICQRDPLTSGAHVAFQSPDRATVDAFHAAALAAGGQDNGAAGLRPEYHAGYYSAFGSTPTETTSRPSATCRRRHDRPHLRGAVRREDSRRVCRLHAGHRPSRLRGHCRPTAASGCCAATWCELTEFVMFTLWDSIDSIRGFAGDDPETAVFYPEDDRFLVERDLRSTHFEVHHAPARPGEVNLGADAAWASSCSTCSLRRSSVSRSDRCISGGIRDLKKR